MEMFEIMKQRMPEGLNVIKVKDDPHANRMQIWFSYDGLEVTGWLNKTCIPGMETNVCDFTICTAMMNVALLKKDMNMAQVWLKKTQALNSST